MQITSTPPASTSAYSISSPSPSPAGSKPEDFLTSGDVQMIEYVSGTTSLAAAEEDPNAKALAVSLGTKREGGWVQGDVSKDYFYSQLTPSDAQMIESMTGTTNIIDAINAGGQSISGLADQIMLDRGDGSLTGNITAGYLDNIKTFDETQDSKHGGEGIMVLIDTLNQALAYVNANAAPTVPTTETNSTYSATA